MSGGSRGERRSHSCLCANSSSDIGEERAELPGVWRRERAVPAGVLLSRGLIAASAARNTRGLGFDVRPERVVREVGMISV